MDWIHLTFNMHNTNITCIQQKQYIFEINSAFQVGLTVVFRDRNWKRWSNTR